MRPTQPHAITRRCCNGGGSRLKTRALRVERFVLRARAKCVQRAMLSLKSNFCARANRLCVRQHLYNMLCVPRIWACVIKQQAAQISCRIHMRPNRSTTRAAATRRKTSTAVLCFGFVFVSHTLVHRIIYKCYCILYFTSASMAQCVGDFISSSSTTAEGVSPRSSVSHPNTSPHGRRSSNLQRTHARNGSKTTFDTKKSPVSACLTVSAGRPLQGCWDMPTSSCVVCEGIGDGSARPYVCRRIIAETIRFYALLVVAACWCVITDYPIQWTRKTNNIAASHART